MIGRFGNSSIDQVHNATFSKIATMFVNLDLLEKESLVNFFGIGPSTCQEICIFNCRSLHMPGNLHIHLQL